MRPTGSGITFLVAHKANSLWIRNRARNGLCMKIVSKTEIANREAWQEDWKRAKIENVAMLLEAALRADEKVGIKMNVSEKKLKKVIDLLPALNRPTISPLSRKAWLAVETIVNEDFIREIIPTLKRAVGPGPCSFGWKRQPKR